MTTAAAVLIDQVKALRRTTQGLVRRLGQGETEAIIKICNNLIQRLELGVDHTIVALIGGTGSGKSSLFNALAEMDFAVVGPVRPTTERPTACVWGGDAADLLEWLGIGRQDQIRRDSVLEEHIEALRGLILLDLPDYDSQVPQHRAAAERILPQADVLVWVTDPQKYADPVLHARYLGELRGRERSMLVVLNQSDRLAKADVESVRDHLASLLNQDELDKPVVVTSALTGQGIPELREQLVGATAHQTTAATRAARDLAAAAGRLIDLIGDPKSVLSADGAIPSWINQAHQQAASTLFRITGAEAACQSLTRRKRPPIIAVPDQDQLQAILQTWIETTLGNLPLPWGPAAGHTLASAKNIAARLTEALAKVTLPTPAAGLKSWLFARRFAADRAADYRQTITTALDGVIQLTLINPTLAVLEDWTYSYRVAAGIGEG